MDYMKLKDVTSYKIKTGETLYKYRIRYKDRFGKWKEKSRQGFQTEKAAMRDFLETKALLLDGEMKHIEHETITIGEWLDIWYDGIKDHLKISTSKQYEMYIRLYFKPLLGTIRLQQLDRQTYQRLFINHLLRKYKVSTVKTIHTVFKTAINAAAEEEILLRSRINKVKISKPNEIEEKKLYYYDAAQLEKFLSTAKTHASYPVYISFLLLAYTGMRKGELLALTHDDVNFLTNTITINKTRDGNGVRPPKTKNSYRVVSVDPSVMEELKKYQLWTKKTMLKFGYGWSGNSYLMISTTGENKSHNSYTYIMKKIQNVAKLPVIPLHGLRHTHATLLMLNPGTSVKAISERLGHTVDMLNRTYAHVLEGTHYSTMLAFSEVVKHHKEAVELTKKENEK